MPGNNPLPDVKGVPVSFTMKMSVAGLDIEQTADAWRQSKEFRDYLDQYLLTQINHALSDQNAEICNLLIGFRSVTLGHNLFEELRELSGEKDEE